MRDFKLNRKASNLEKWWKYTKAGEKMAKKRIERQIKEYEETLKIFEDEGKYVFVDFCSERYDMVETIKDQYERGWLN